MDEAICLLIYGIVAGVLAPPMLAWLTASGRAPRLGVAAWLAASLSVLIAWGWSGLRAFSFASSWLVKSVVAVALGVLTLRIVWILIVTIRDTSTRRTRHRDGLRLLGRPDADLGALVVDAAHPMAYCLPGRDNLVVITSGARATLTATQLQAVLAHERGHLSGRHHLALATAYGLARVLPWLPAFAALGQQVPLLLEMRADDLAARAYGRGTVARAIAAMTRTPAPAGLFGAGGPTVRLRVGRLLQPVSALRRRVIAAISSVAVAVLATGPYLVTIDPWCPHLPL